MKAKGRKTESHRSGNGDEKTPEEPKIPFPRKTGGTGTIGQVPHGGSGIGRFRRLRLRRRRIGQSAVHATFQRGLLKLSITDSKRAQTRHLWWCNTAQIVPRFCPGGRPRQNLNSLACPLLSIYAWDRLGVNGSERD